MWYLAVRQMFLAMYTFFLTCTTKTSAMFARLFGATIPVMDLPVTTTPIVSISVLGTALSEAKYLISRFGVKPLVFAYNEVDASILRIGRSMARNSPTSIRPVSQKLKLKLICKSLLRWLEVQLLRLVVIVHNAHADEQPEEDIISPIAAPTQPEVPQTTVEIVDDSGLSFYCRDIRQSQTNEWKFFVPGAGDKAGIEISESVWSDYQQYRVTTGLEPVASPSKINVLDFQIYENEMAQIGLLMSSTPSSVDLSSSTSGTSPTGFYSSSSESPLTFPGQSLDNVAITVIKFDSADTANSMDIAEANPAAIAMPLSAIVQDKGAFEVYCSRVPTIKSKNNFASINSFSQIEALFEESFGVPIGDPKEIFQALAKGKISRYRSPSVSSVYSQESASSEQRAVFDALPRDLSILCPVTDVDVVTEDDTTSDKVDDLVTSVEEGICVTNIDLEDSAPKPYSLSIVEQDDDNQGDLSGTTLAETSFESFTSQDVTLSEGNNSLTLHDSTILKSHNSYIHDFDLTSSHSAILSGKNASVTAVEAINSLPPCNATPLSSELQAPAPLKIVKKANRLARVTSGLAIDLKSLASGISSFQKRIQNSRDSKESSDTTLDALESQSFSTPSSTVSSRTSSWITFRIPSIVSPRSDGSSTSVTTPNHSIGSFIGIHEDFSTEKLYSEEVRSRRIAIYGPRPKGIRIPNAIEGANTPPIIGEPPHGISTHGAHLHVLPSPGLSSPSESVASSAVSFIPNAGLSFSLEEQEAAVVDEHIRTRAFYHSQKSFRRVSGLRPLMLPSLLATRIPTAAPNPRESRWGIPF